MLTVQDIAIIAQFGALYYLYLLPQQPKKRPLEYFKAEILINSNPGEILTILSDPALRKNWEPHVLKAQGDEKEH